MSDLESTLHVTATLTRMPKGARVVVYADGAVFTVPLPRRGSLTIGRATDADLRIDHPSVSRAHACLHIGPPLTIEDVGSHNGTRVRGGRLEPKQRAPVTAGDIVKIGTALLMIQPGEVQSDTRRLLAPAFVESRAEELLADGRRLDAIVALTRGPLPPDIVAATLAAAVPREHMMTAPKNEELLVVLIDAAHEVDTLRQRLQAAALGIGTRIGFGHAASKARTKHLRELAETAHKQATSNLPKRPKGDSLLTQHEAISLMNSAIGLYAEERYEQARAMAEIALELLEHDDGGASTMCLISVAVAAREHGDVAHAEKLFERALVLAKRAEQPGAEALIAEQLAACHGPVPARPQRVVVARTQRKIHLGKTEVDLARRRPLWLLVEALADARLRTPGTAIERATLLERGWPGERIHPSAALNRLYVAIATLRRLGIRDVLLNRDDGYLLDPQVDLVARD